MFRKLVIGLGVVIALVSVGLTDSVQARLSKVLNVESAGKQPAKPQLSLVECEQGIEVLTSAGFSRVFATDCTGSQYQFNGFRGTQEYTVVFNALSSGFSTVSK